LQILALKQREKARQEISDEARSKFFDQGQVTFLFLRLGQPSLVWVRIISPKNPKIFNFFSLGQKKYLWVRSKSIRVKDRSVPYLLRVKRMFV